jgi:hypothetical protein
MNNAANLTKAQKHLILDAVGDHAFAMMFPMPGGWLMTDVHTLKCVQAHCSAHGVALTVQGPAMFKFAA